MDNESTIMEKLDYLEGTKTSIRNAIIAKGQEVDEEDTFRSYAQKIAAIETGIDTSDATATASDIKAGKTAYVDGVKIEGIHVDEDLNSVITAQETKIAELEALVRSKTDNQFKIYDTVAHMEAATAREGDKAVVYTENLNSNPQVFNFIGFYRYDGTDWIQLSANISQGDYNTALTQAQGILD